MCLKICKKCNVEKDITQYHYRESKGYDSTCRSCISNRRRELKLSNSLRIKTELHKIVLVENKILRQEGLSQCHTCKTKIPISNTNHYCLDCQKKQRERDREKVLASKKAYRDKNKEKQKAYRDSIKEKRREYDAMRYHLRRGK